MMFRRRLYTRPVQRSVRFYPAVLVTVALLMAGAAAVAMWQVGQTYQDACVHPLKETRALAVAGLGAVLLALVLLLWVACTVLCPLDLPVGKPQSASVPTTLKSDDKGCEQVGALEPDVPRVLAGLRILVVDDSALNREVATGFLEAAGIQVETAKDGLEALLCLQQQPLFDAVLMDLQMPNMGGVEATRAIRQQPQWAQLPVIALTAQDEFAGRESTLAAGMDAYLTKPIDGASLYQILWDCLPHAHGWMPLPTACLVPRDAAPVSALPDLLPLMDLRVTLGRLGGEYPRLVRLARGFVRDFAHIPAQWRNPSGALPRDSLAAVAHTMQSAAQYLGAEGLAAAAVALEVLARQGDSAALQPAVEAFCFQLEAVLQSLTGLVAPDRLDKAVLDVPALQSQLAMASSMVAQGNYAATGLLVGIAAGLSQTEWAAQAEKALLQFEDLDLTGAGATLAALAQALAGHP